MHRITYCSGLKKYVSSPRHRNITSFSGVKRMKSWLLYITVREQCKAFIKMMSNAAAAAGFETFWHPNQSLPVRVFRNESRLPALHTCWEMILAGNFASAPGIIRKYSIFGKLLASAHFVSGCGRSHPQSLKSSSLFENFYVLLLLSFCPWILFFFVLFMKLDCACFWSCAISTYAYDCWDDYATRRGQHNLRSFNISGELETDLDWLRPGLRTEGGRTCHVCPHRFDGLYPLFRHSVRMLYVSLCCILATAVVEHCKNTTLDITCSK